jgi:hypothetical protein
MSWDRAAGWVVFLLSLGVFWVAWFAVSMAQVRAIEASLVAAVVAVLLGVGAFVYWRRWRREQEEGISRTLADWRERTAVLRSRINRLFQDL